MKIRVKTDISLLIAIILFSGILLRFPRLYAVEHSAEDVLDFLGAVIIFKGIFIRMAARGYKKAHSSSGLGLVTGGPYSLIRNPMYMGSFFLGSGFILITWPFWILPVFAAIFYLRFKPQIEKEETFLRKSFPEKYEEYARRVPRLFPSLQGIYGLKVSQVFPKEYLWTTKEKWGLLGWPVLAVALDALQEKILYGEFEIVRSFVIFGSAFGLLALVKLWEYRRG